MKTIARWLRALADMLDKPVTIQGGGGPGNPPPPR